MASSDDDLFGDDSFMLDADVLLALEATEQSYGRALSSSVQLPPPARAVQASIPMPAPAYPIPPRSKRLKVDNNAVASSSRGHAKPPPASVSSVDDDLPEIMMTDDGGYAFTLPPQSYTAFQPTLQQTATPPVSRTNQGTSLSNAGAVAVSSGTGLSKGQQPVIQRVEPITRPQPLQPSQLHKNRSNAYHPLQHQTPYQPSQSQSSTVKSRPRSIPPPQTRLQHPAPPVAPSSTSINGSVAELEAQLARLRDEVAQAQASKEESERTAQELQEKLIRREGELANVRRSYDQQIAHNHEVISKLRQEKMMGDDQRSQMERNYNAEMDRMKTKITFQQHENDTSSRKSVWGSSAKRPPSTQYIRDSTQLPSTIRKGTQSSVRLEAMKTPSRRKSGPGDEGAIGGGKQGGSAKADKPQFRTFFNSFAPSPSKPDANKDLKGKGKAKEILSSQSSVHQPSQEDQLVAEFIEMDVDVGDRDAAESSTGRRAVEFSTPSRRERDGREVIREVVLVRDSEVDRFSFWKDELHHLLFSHVDPICQLSNTGPAHLTLGTLISVVLPSAPAEQDAYVHACNELLNAFSSVGRGKLAYNESEREWETLVGQVAKSLEKMAQTLLEAELIKPLGALVHLLTTLVLSLPTLGPVLLTPPDAATPPAFLSVLCGLIGKHWTLCLVDERVNITAGSSKDEWAPLARAVLEMMEALCWTASPNTAVQLAIFTQKVEVIRALFKPDQPAWVIVRAARVLVLLASHQHIYRELLNLPEYEPVPQHQISNPRDDLPIISVLASILLTPPQDATYVQTMSIVQSIFTFLCSLSTAHSDVLTVFFNSFHLVPSAIYCLGWLTERLWEPDPSVLRHPDDHLRLICQTIHYALHFLRYLIYTPKPQLPLRQKLQLMTASREYNGLVDVFIVSVGRLTASSTPEGLDMSEESRQILERVLELANDLLVVVVAGPEEDFIWSAYQEEDEERRSGRVSDTEGPEMDVDFDDVKAESS
ncbi:hypothetical protein BOTBODRAFT_25877 [Botryobasidium botryosum FD-172 SS1]|uniref:Uncharacterized protein n=1 Tax=Botryobasidium botryosum (strain FD-172 SS1) TaxID=930990 RepID=A0A067N0Q9_BOTB1|nr:hypothetical protein BOTBODRAFT_25877 [Botryobasidium botryosum FD-172 SS1]